MLRERDEIAATYAAFATSLSNEFRRDIFPFEGSLQTAVDTNLPANQQLSATSTCEMLNAASHQPHRADQMPLQRFRRSSTVPSAGAINEQPGTVCRYLRQAYR